MLALTGQEHFYFIPGCTDMRYGYRKLSEIVRHKFLRDPLNGDVYIFMNASRNTVRKFQRQPLSIRAIAQNFRQAQ